MSQTSRTRPDRCPGIVHPWPADDGGLVRVRVPGGQVSRAALTGLARVAEEYGDGRVRVTGRANLQVRAMPLTAGGVLAGDALAALEATGLLPSRAHDRVRNVLASPQTGLAGGRADLRPVLADLDALLLGDATLAGLPGRFLFTLDDGRGDLADKHLDLGLVALDATTAQLRVGEHWGDVVPLTAAPAALAALAREFLAARGTGPDAPWHVPELGDPLAAPRPASPGAAVATGPLPLGPVAGGTHVACPDEGLDLATIAGWTAATVVVTPWHGVLIPEEN
ncbi:MULTISPECIES: nitrite reductase [unclassified Nocardioides]|uniref:nitrite reductase n=1 Tax=unclassified Nocardioides TaxID=2615069 RepID=UPI00070302C3|nr:MULTISPECIES: nitrite reductase [unclassified Nocardioides]KRC48725.1 nitrite reductase [Nocardioides sp. Root79]KRC75125.1 nitrite reductase [Nocardioides sp. Root240]